MGDFWIPGGRDGDGGHRPGGYIPQGSSDKKKGGCEFAIPLVMWTVVKLVFKAVVRKLRPNTCVPVS